MTVSLILNIIYNALPQYSIGGMMLSIMYDMGIPVPNDAAQLIYESGSTGVSVDWISTFLIVTLCLFFFFSLSKRMTLTAPSIMFKIYAIIQLVANCLAALGILVTSIAGLVMVCSNRYVHNYAVPIIMFICLLIAAGIFVLFGITQMRFAQSIRHGVLYGQESNSGAMGFAIFCFIKTAISIMSIVGTCMMGAYVNVGFPIVVQCFTILATVMFGILAVKYSKAMTGGQPYVSNNHFNTFKKNNVGEKGSYCPNCGTKNTPDSRFCSNCGTKLK